MTAPRSARPARRPSSSTASGRGAWRILVGDDARHLDSYVRANPDDAYDYARLSAARDAARDQAAGRR